MTNVPVSKTEEAYELTMQRIILPYPPEIDEDTWMFWERAGERFVGSSIVVGRSLLVLESGWFGVGPVGSTPGDIVIIISGLEMPLILRKRSRAITYKLIGGVYVHGIMKGEAMEYITQKTNSQQMAYVID